MKIKFLLFVLLLAGTIASAQKKPLKCGTPKNIPNFAANIDTNLVRFATDPIRIKVYVINFIRYDDFDYHHWINNEISRMNMYFNPHNICFELIGYRSVDDDSLSVMDLGNPRDISKLQSYRVSNVLTIFFHAFVDDENGNSIGGTAYNIPNTYFSLALDNIGDYSGAHEAGHCLGLYHTFHGNPGVEDGPGTCWERVNGSNANSCGDFVNDTHADPYGLTGARVNSICTYVGTAVDASGALYTNVPTGNVMAYWGVEENSCDVDGLTLGQAARSRLSVASPLAILFFYQVDQVNITYNGGGATNGEVARATIGTLTANNYVLLNSVGGLTAKRVTLTPGSRIAIISAKKNFVLKSLTCTD